MIGVLLSNLGTPDVPNSAALRRYLAEFLWDRRVVDLPRPLWWMILNGVVLNTRPAKSARLYQKIWTDKGSPLLVTTKRQATQLGEIFKADNDTPIAFEIGMRYGSPSIASGLEALRDQGCDKILIFPLYPQFSSATTASTFDAVASTLATWKNIPSHRFIADYHDDLGYVTALTDSIRRRWEENGEPGRLLFSFHGMPAKTRAAGDPYYDQCLTTADLVGKQLDDRNVKWAVAFQSKFGRDEWLTPATDETLAGWAREKFGRVDVICPGFAADCLETLEEIAMANREDYQAAGGGEYRFIPCLNDSPAHITALAAIIRRNLGGWT